MVEFDCSDACTEVIDTAMYKSTHYGTEPLAYMDISDIIVQIKIKCERAKQALTNEKRADEVLDVAVYAIKVLQRIMDEEAQKPTVADNAIDAISILQGIMDERPNANADEVLGVAVVALQHIVDGGAQIMTLDPSDGEL